MSYSDFIDLVTRNTSNRLENYKELCRICLEHQVNGIDISDTTCSSIKRRERIQRNYITITKQHVNGRVSIGDSVNILINKRKLHLCIMFQLPTSDEYPKFVCSACEIRLDQLALFAQQIDENAKNWDIFLAREQTSEHPDIFDVFNDCDMDNKPANETIEIKIEFCDGKYDSVPDTDEYIYDALDLPPLKIEEMNTEALNGVSAMVEPKKKRTRKLKVIKSTEFERTCKHCDAPTFSSLARMSSHQKQMHPGVKIYSCDICAATFISKNAMASHMSDRHANNGRKHQCQFCAKLFFSDREVRGHEKLHLNARSYVCNLCGKGFNQKTRLNVHLRSKVHNANYKTVKRKHSSSKKKQIYKRTFRCEQCLPATVHGNAEELAMHRSTVHKLYECDVCKNSFLSINTLNSHKLLHSNKPRPHVCSVCNATFNQSSHLTSHFKRKHTDEKSFECSLCDKAFYENFELNSHMNLVHTKHERAKCNECGLDFASAKYLQKHIRFQHSLVATPYDCKDCGKKYVSNGKLELHRRKCHVADNQKVE